MSLTFAPPKTEYVVKIDERKPLFEDLSPTRRYKLIQIYRPTKAIRPLYGAKLYETELIKPETPNTREERSTERSSDFEWFLKSVDVLENFKGQYVAILDRKIVAHGKTAGEVLKKIKGLPKKALVSFVPTEEVLEL